MTNEEIFNKLSDVKKGKYISLKKSKDLGCGVKKISDIVIRLGVVFKNMKVNEGRTDFGPLPWGHWVEGYEGLVIEHKGNYYLRVASSYSNNTKVTYMLSDKEIDRKQVVDIVGEKKLISGKPDVYNVKFQNILQLGCSDALV
jgi:hypothetical protein